MRRLPEPPWAPDEPPWSGEGHPPSSSLATATSRCRRGGASPEGAACCRGTDREGGPPGRVVGEGAPPRGLAGRSRLSPGHRWGGRATRGGEPPAAGEGALPRV
ncbi:hypothetical protein PR202_ga30856 [Eleusine coracana subsp. coracana]|uniref:Uncharacterized protein n=1 Tax=Eleusine coracana subsp. coracana TaxID=191504 RepID=A0AAV5DQV2_ELECO|nr:hypothetical protein PR202_ga30856 [Eleusine coracana subsp. coracana]